MRPRPALVIALVIAACGFSAAPLLAAAGKDDAAAARRRDTPAPAAVNATTAAASNVPSGSSIVPPFGLPYSYNADGRRDPFQTLAGSGGDSKVPPKPTAAGVAGILVDDLAVRGIMQSRDRLVAMIQGPDNRTYLIHQGDKLADGVVKSITPQGLVLVQDVSDPGAKEQTREVRKTLRSAEDDKE